MTSRVRTLFALAFALAAPMTLAQTTTPPPARTAAAEPAPIVNLPDFTRLVERAGPAVVNIEATSGERDDRELAGGPGRQEPLPEDVPEFFRRFFEQQPGTPMPVPRGGVSQGTGFIISADGYVLTNHHVVAGADDIIVRLTDQNELKAELIGSDPLSDVALLKVSGTGLPVLAIGDSRSLKPGQWVLAIGSPFGFDHSVTAGIVSGVGRRSLDPSQQYVPFIQTDVAINRGNSGGPLLNVRGEVVGMNTAIYTDQRSANIGIGFATPINTIRAILPQLRLGRVTRGVIGVQVRTYPLSKEDAQAFGLPNTNGAVLTTVTEGKPAEKAGLQRGDVITEFNGKPVVDSDTLVSMVLATKPGATVPLTVYREGQRKSMNITIGELDLDAEQGTPTEPTVDSEPTSAGFGMTIEPITPDIARELRLPSGKGGAIVSNVGRASPAFNAGVAPNDVILEVNRKPVSNVSQVKRALDEAAPGSTVFMVVWRAGAAGGQETFLTLRKR
jgi:serine protease Do